MKNGPRYLDHWNPFWTGWWLGGHYKIVQNSPNCLKVQSVMYQQGWTNQQPANHIAVTDDKFPSFLTKSMKIHHSIPYLKEKTSLFSVKINGTSHIPIFVDEGTQIHFLWWTSCLPRFGRVTWALLLCPWRVENGDCKMFGARTYSYLFNP